MADKKSKSAVKRAVPVAPPGVTFGEVEAFDSVPPAKGGKGRYPWATIQQGERFAMPSGSRSSVSAMAKKYAKTFVVREDEENPAVIWVFCTATGVAQTSIM